MAQRSPQQQSVHDRKVKEIADRLDRNGWTVRADVDGYPQPDTIGKKYPRRPDIYATKRGATRIIEVETEAGADQRQHEVFRRSAAHQNRTTFRVVLA